MQIKESENSITIEGLDDNFEIEAVIEGIENGTFDEIQIEGLFSFVKKAFKKVKKVAGFANKLGLLPPGVGFGLSTLKKLEGYSKKYGKKINFSPTATKNIYSAAYLRGYSKGLLLIQNYINRVKR